MSVSPNIGIAINTNVTIAGEDGISKNYTIILGEEGVLNETLYPKEYVLFTFLRSYTNDIDLLLYWNGFNRFSYLDIQEFISNNDPPEDMDPSDYLRLYVKWNILSKLPPKSMLLMTSHFNSMEYLIYRFRNEIDTTGVRDIPEEWANPDYTYYLNNSVTDELILIITDRYLTFDPDLDDLAREYSIRWFNKYFRNIFPAFHDYILRKGLLNPEIFDKVRLGSTLSYNIKLSDEPLSIFIWLDYINGEFIISSISISIDSIDETLKSLVEIYTANNFSLVKEFFNEIIHNLSLIHI